MDRFPTLIIGPPQDDLMAEHVGPAREAGTFIVTVRNAAELLQHASRRRIVVEPPGSQLCRAQCVEGKGRSGGERPRCVALAPIGLAQPIAEFPAACRMNAAGPDIGTGRFAQNRERQILPLDQPCAALTMKAQALSSVYGWGTRERFFTTAKIFQ